MLRRLIALLITSVLALSMCGVACADGSTTEYDFKTFKWGDSESTVRAVEGTPDGSGDMDSVDAHYIYYKTRAVGLDVALAYYFCDDGLYAVRYVSTEDHSNESKYIDDYKSFKAALTSKYGDPLLDNESWDTDSHKSYYANNKGDALCYGYLTYYTWWITDTTWISMNMDADNYDVSMTVDYSSLAISPGSADYSDQL